MKILRVALAGAVAALTALAADEVLGDAHRGEQLFQTEQCVQCHGINGRGGALAPDLGKHIGRDFTPTVMASLMWNHAPEMWPAMRKQGIVKGTLSPESAADLFAYFVSARYFERSGDAGRGKQVFAAKHCADCHGVTTSAAAGAPGEAKWTSLADPTTLVQQMWNHGEQMRQAYTERTLRWSPLTSQELRDMLVYLQNLPETRELVTAFEFPPSASGAALFQSKGCATCHQGKLALENRLRNQNLTDIAVDMWNHQASMKQPAPKLSQEEMRQILGYVWTRQYFRGSGDAVRGKQVFTVKNCASCHSDSASGAPLLSKGVEGYSDITIISALWEHGPRMLDLMTERKLVWPRFTAAEMADLIAYLNSR
ncbi:MAG TPA: c-type cytochrome [Bryobacteraceae bacterium]|jgi:mono/diheme cytochrome c family protein|nr:c-type cytochrome [Bryobacteraceae bacterium]